jgi:hypothetical protein
MDTAHTPGRSVTLADASCDEALRALAHAGEPLRGWCQWSWRFPSSFLQGIAVQGTEVQTLVARDGGEVVGMATRAIRPVYANGREQNVGYLGQLRVRRDKRRGLILEHGMRFLRACHGDGRCRLYLATILSANHLARHVLTSARGSLPTYHDHGTYHTFAFSPAFLARADAPDDGRVTAGRQTDFHDAMGLLERAGRTQPLFPVCRPAFLGTPYWRGLNAEDFFVARDARGRPVGVCALWDQRVCRQLTVTRYAAPVHSARRVCNVLLRLSGRVTLPPPGVPLAEAHLAFLHVDDADPRVAAALLRAIAAEARARGIGCLVLGRHTADPLHAALMRLPSLRFASRVYVVCWADGEGNHRTLSSPFLHLETACL